MLPENLISASNTLTIELWLKTTGYGVIFGQQEKLQTESSASKVPILYVGKDGRLRGEFWYGHVLPITSTTTINDGQWHHIALSSTGTSQTLYLDGVLVDTKTGTVNNNALSMKYNQLGTGTWGGWPESVGASVGIKGEIEELRLWKVARIQAEIEQFKKVKYIENDPVETQKLTSVWHFDEGTGNTAKDSKGINNGAFPTEPSLKPTWVSSAFPPTNLDISIVSIVTPKSACILGTAESLTVKLQNTGTATIAKVGIAYKLNNNATITEQIPTLNLLPGAVKDYTFISKLNLFQAQTYQLKIFTSLAEDGLKGNDTLRTTLIHYPPFTAPLIKDTTVCSKSPAVLKATGGKTYLWSTGETNAQITVYPTQTTIYEVAITNEFGCTAKVKVTVKVDTITRPKITANKISGCVGEKIIVTVDLKGNNEWSTGGKTDSIWVTKPGKYYVSHKDPNGCKGTSDTISISFVPKPTIKPVANVLCKGSEITLTAVNATTFKWHIGKSATAAALTATFKVKPLLSTTYYLKATNGTGCANTDSISIKVIDVITPGVVTTMLPANNAANLPQPIAFSWVPGANALSYDLYIWPQGAVRPTSPTVSGLTQINYSHYSLLSDLSKYQWQVVSKSACKNTDSPIQKFSVKIPPDLSVESVLAPANTTFEAGSKISIQWKVKNTGTDTANGAGATHGAWYDGIYLSANNTLGDGDDERLGLVFNDIYLNTSKQNSYIKTAEFTLPPGKVGTFYILVVADATGLQVEKLENNNVTASNAISLKVTKYPDLQVMSPILVPADTFSNEVITISYTVKNVGTSPTAASGWRDWIYGSPSDDPNDSEKILLGHVTHTGVLEAGQSYTGVLKAQLPQKTFGNYHIHVNTDFEGLVYEYLYETNNWRASSPINIYLTPPPDLVVDEISVPTLLAATEKMSLAFKVSNVGTGATAETGWIDKVYVVDRPIQPTVKKLLSTVAHAGAVKMGEGYLSNISVYLPPLGSGTYYILVETDPAEKVFEWKSEHNNNRYSEPFHLSFPDLIPQIIEVPDTIFSGKEATIIYSVKNLGPGSVINQGWVDEIVLKSTTSAETISLKVSQQASIDVGESYVSTKKVLLPVLQASKFTFQVKANVGNTIFENGQNSNNTSALSKVVLAKLPPVVPVAPWADLQVSTMSHPATADANAMIDVKWTVTNAGKATAKPYWTDKIYISPKATPLNSLFLGSVVHYDSLQPKGAYSQSCAVKIPDYYVGESLLQIRSDAIPSQVYENTAEGNNTRSGPIIIRKYPPVDLAVDKITAPTTGWSGKKIEITYVVKNKKDGKTLKDSWVDRVFLSRDKTIHESGVLKDSLLAHQLLHTGTLAKDQSYLNKVSVNLPNGVNGAFFLLVQTDHQGAIVELVADKINNTLASLTPITIAATPPPDLQITSLTAPTEGLSGQALSIAWKVENKGTGQAPAVGWRDDVYLSANSELESNDLFVGSFSHTDSLGIGKSYMGQANIHLPLSAKGSYFLIVVTDAQNTLYEPPLLKNNTKTSVITIIQPPPADLTVKNIQMPGKATVGDSLTISWETVNKGQNPATGTITEDIYFSTDEGWDAADEQVGSVTYPLNLQSNSSKLNSAHVLAPGLVPQAYYIIIRTDISNRIVEDSEDNNAVASLPTMEVNIPTLVIDQPLHLKMDGQQSYYYKIQIPDYLIQEVLSVRFTTDTPANLTNVYIRYQGVPDAANFDLRAEEPLVATQEMIVPGLKAGEYYVMLKGEFAGVQNIILQPSILPFLIRSVNVSKGGNSGLVTTEIQGSKFSAITRFGLKQGKTFHPASYSKNINLTKTFTTFDLKGKALGAYDTYAISERGDTTVLKSGFEVVPGDQSGLSLHLQHPSSVRGTQVISVSLDYINAGNIDIASPKVRFISTGDCPIALHPDDLNTKTPVVVLDLSLKELNGPEAVLRAGKGGSVVIYCLAKQAPTFTITQVK